MHRPARWTPSLLTGLLVATTLWSTACGPTCAQTCRRYYSEDECDATPVGQTASQAIKECTAQCNSALEVPGDPVAANDARFNPAIRASTAETFKLANEQEASAWIDCVWTFEDDVCEEELLNGGCVPIYGDR